MAIAIRKELPLPPSQEDALLAENAVRALSSQYRKNGFIHVGDCGDERINLPEGVVEQLLEILSEMARGNSVTLVPIKAELTTQQAANILSVSRPYLIKLLDEGRIPARRVGTHRRVRAEDVFKYKGHVAAERARTLDEMAKLGQELGLD